MRNKPPIATRGRRLTVLPPKLIYHRDVSSTSSRNFSLSRRSVTNVSILAVSMIFECSPHECQRRTQENLCFDLSKSPRWRNEGPETQPWCHLDPRMSGSRKLQTSQNEQERFRCLLQGQKSNDIAWWCETCDLNYCNHLCAFHFFKNLCRNKSNSQCGKINDTFTIFLNVKAMIVSKTSIKNHNFSNSNFLF